MSAVLTNRDEELSLMKALWDLAFDTLTKRPSPTRMTLLLWKLPQIPCGWELYVRRDEALCAIRAACTEFERWLASVLDTEVQEFYNDSDSMGFEHLELSTEVETTRSLDSPLGSEFKDFSDDGTADQDTESTAPDRAQTM
ncbi:hypothetical protein PMIN06_010595 [Paraphaeosphaeria minitans]